MLGYLQEREGKLKELLASNLNKHQKTAKNINVNNSVTLTNHLVFDKSGPAFPARRQSFLILTAGKYHKRRSWL